MFSFTQALNTTVRPAYFDDDWPDLVAELDIDLESSLLLREAMSARTLFEEFTGTSYPGAIRVFTYGLVNLVSGSAGYGFYIRNRNLRCRVRLKDHSSPLTPELQGLFLALIRVLEEQLRDDSHATVIATWNGFLNPHGHILGIVVPVRTGWGSGSA